VAASARPPTAGLVERVRDAGLNVTLSMQGTPRAGCRLSTPARA
jgi:hypothetical protein